MNLDAVIARSRELLHARIDERALAYMEGRAPDYSACALTAAPAAPKRKYVRKLSDGMSLATILENVDEAFESSSLPTTYSMTDKAVVRGLRRMGPWVPYGGKMEPYEETLIKRERWPGLVFVSRGYQSDHHDGFEASGTEYGLVAFAYAVKLERPPFFVEKHSTASQHYEFGLAFRLKKKLQWVSAYIEVDANGDIMLCRERTNHRVQLQRGRNRGEWYTQRRQSMPIIDTCSIWGDMDARRKVLRGWFAWTLNWWERRGERWTVSLLKNERRVTFSIEMGLTKTFFVDRDKSVLLPSGQRKKIIHHVVSHGRRLSSGRTTTVREHIRGLRRFDWRGYDCAVTAPAFHSFALEKFDISSVTDDNAFADKRYVQPPQIGRLLADLEHTQQARHIP